MLMNDKNIFDRYSVLFFLRFPRLFYEAPPQRRCYFLSSNILAGFFYSAGVIFTVRDICTRED